MSYKPLKSQKLSLGVLIRSSPRILFPTERDRVESRFSAVQSMILAHAQMFCIYLGATTNIA